MASARAVAVDAAEVVHLIRSADHKSFTSACGVLVLRERYGRPPANMSAWGSDVTCPDCVKRLDVRIVA